VHNPQRDYTCGAGELNLASPSLFSLWFPSPSALGGALPAAVEPMFTGTYDRSQLRTEKVGRVCTNPLIENTLSYDRGK
jgi:hypothetical protein